MSIFWRPGLSTTKSCIVTYLFFKESARIQERRVTSDGIGRVVTEIRGNDRHSEDIVCPRTSNNKRTIHGYSDESLGGGIRVEGVSP